MSGLRRALGFGVAGVVLAGAAVERIDRRERAIEASIGRPVPVLVTTRQVRAGTRLAAASLAVRRVPERWAPAGVVSEAGRAWGRVSIVDLPPGAYVPAGAIASGNPGLPADLGPDERVATVVASAAPGAIRPGARVDVVVARSGHRPTVAMRGAQVVAVRAVEADQVGDVRTGRVSADLRTDVAGALELASAAQEGAEITLLPLGGFR